MGTSKGPNNSLRSKNISSPRVKISPFTCKGPKIFSFASIGPQILQACVLLSTLSLPKVQMIPKGPKIFQAHALKSRLLPAKVQKYSLSSIGPQIFQACVLLSTLSLPKVQIIPKGPKIFQAHALKSCLLPAKVQKYSLLLA